MSSQGILIIALVAALSIGTGATLLYNSCPQVQGCHCFETGAEYRAECYDPSMGSFPDGLPTNLTELQIMGTNLTELASGTAMSTLVNLKELDLSRNKLATIQSNVLDALTKLEVVSLRDNVLVSLPMGLFSRQTVMRELTLSGNGFTDVQTSAFGSLSALEKLYLEENIISGVASDAFATLTGLRYLNLQHNEMLSISDNAFSGLGALGILDLDNNNISQIMSQTFNGLSAALEELRLNFNQITTITSTPFASLTGLKRLYLGHNYVSSITSSAFNGLTSIEDLYLMDNQLTIVPTDAINHLRSLFYIDLSGNRFSTVGPSILNNLHLLEFLELGDMPTLTSIQLGAFTGLVELSNLVITKNPNLLTFTQDHVAELDDLEFIYLHDNGFRDLNEAIFTSQPRLTRADIHGNPFHCNCTIEWIARVVQDEIPWALHWKNSATPPKCGSPPHLELHPIPNMVLADLTCYEATIYRVSAARQTVHMTEDVEIQAKMDHGLPTSMWITPEGTTVQPYVLPGADLTDGVLAEMVASRIYVTEEIVDDVIHTVLTTLHIQNVTVDDAGAYVIVAANVIGNVTETFEIDVLPYPPTTAPPGTEPPIDGSPSRTLSWNFLILMAFILSIPIL